MTKDRIISFRVTEHDAAKLELIKQYYQVIYPDIKNFTTTMLIDICISNTYGQIEKYAVQP